MEGVQFTIPGPPCPWARAGKHGKVQFTPSKQRNAMAVAKDLAFQAMNGHPPFEGPLELTILAIYPWPTSMPKKRRNAPGGYFKTTKPDGSNILKLVEDAMNGVVYVDDAQIANLQVQKQYGLTAMTRVTVRRLP